MHIARQHVCPNTLRQAVSLAFVRRSTAVVSEKHMLPGNLLAAQFYESTPGWWQTICHLSAQETSFHLPKFYALNVQLLDLTGSVARHTYQFEKRWLQELKTDRRSEFCIWPSSRYLYQLMAKTMAGQIFHCSKKIWLSQSMRTRMYDQVRIWKVHCMSPRTSKHKSLWRTWILLAFFLLRIQGSTFFSSSVIAKQI